MKTLRQAFKDALSSGQTKMVDCVRIERLDGKIFRFTNHDKKLKMSNGAVYVPDKGGADEKALTAQAGLEGVEIDIRGPLLQNGISKEDLLAGRFDFARIYVFRTLWDDPVEDDEKRATGWWGSTKVTDFEYKATFKSLAGELENEVGFTHMPTCRHELGDSICRVDLENGSNVGGDFTVTGTITNVVNTVTFEDSNRNEPDDHFGAGFIEITTGENSGIKREIDTYTQSSGQFILWDAFPFPIEIGDEYKAVVGCRKRRDQDCKDKFDNVINFGGFPDLPGEDITNEIGTRS